MATGDLKNNLRKLISELKRVNHPQADLDIKGIAQGLPKASLPIVHHVFLEYSYSLAQLFAGKGYDLYGKTDLRFMEVVYKVLRDEFGYKPQLTKDQFLAIGFAERKIIFLCDVLKLMRNKHNGLAPKDTENKKPKNSTSGSKTTSCETAIEAARKTASEKFPGPLPVNTDMRNFKSNQDAEKGGLGLTKPLVVRAMDYEDTNNNGRNIVPSAKIGGREDITGVCNSRRVVRSVEDSVPSNLVVKTSRDQGLCSVKFPVSQNSEVRANLSRQAHPKTVTWEDELLDARFKQDRIQTPQTSALTAGPVNTIFVPTQNHSASYQVKTNQPTHPVNVASTCPPVHTIPSPVVMTSVPRPSQELLLTPTVKLDHPMPIPLSNHRCEQESHSVSRAGLLDSRLPSARVVRHSCGPDNKGEESIVASPSAILFRDDQIYLLTQQLGELQEKFDSLVLSNNEMSARVVLLESRFKLLEEASRGSICTNTCDRSHSTSGRSPSQHERRVVAGFEVNSTTRESVDRSPYNSDGNSCRNGHCAISDIHKSPLAQTSASRKLFDDKSPFHFRSESNNSKDSLRTASPVSSKRLTDGSSNEYHPEPGRSPISLGSPSSIHEVLSSQPTTPEISGVFAESSTKNTVMNVHKTLRETQDLLARTNRDFAAKFSHYQGLQ